MKLYKIKQLTWEKRRLFYMSVNTHICYSIFQDTTNNFRLRIPSGSIYDCHSMEQAKQAAQEDFEERMSKGLEMERWVSVMDDLPDMYVTVWVSDGKGAISQGRRIQYGDEWVWDIDHPHLITEGLEVRYFHTVPDWNVKN